MINLNVENRLLATHITNDPNFEFACLKGDISKIRNIVTSAMEKSGLHTKGSNKLRDDIFNMLQDTKAAPTYTGKTVLAFVWNARLSGTGFAVAH